MPSSPFTDRDVLIIVEDVDGDGDDDLLLQVEIYSEGGLWEEGRVVLWGETYDGTRITGTDYIVIVPE